jgi:hypothetical protein
MATAVSIRKTKVLTRDPMPVDFRAQIRQRLKKLDRTVYWLAEELKSKVTRSAIYGYLREDKPSEIGADKLEKILNLLEEAESKR